MLQKTEFGWSLRSRDITSLMYQAIKQQAYLPTPDAVLSIETHLINVTLLADSCEYSLDVGHELHLNIGRWSRLVREYVDRENVLRFIQQAREIASGEARDGATTAMMFRDPIRYAKKHRYGGCLLSATFNAVKNGKPTLTFYSRTTYISYMGLLDSAIAHIIARGITDPALIQFRWHLPSMQLHAFKSLPYMYRKPILNSHLEKLVRNRKLIDNQPPFWKYAAKWQCKVVDRIEQEGFAGIERERYGPLKRVMRRWLETKQLLSGKKSFTIIPKSLLVSELTFDKAE